MTHLIVTNENNDTDEFRFDAGHSTITLGRRTTNDVRIASPSVSGNHAKITLDEDGVWIEDLNSTNGTFINGERISRHRLDHGDEITVGKSRVSWLGTFDSSSAPDSETARTNLVEPSAIAGNAQSAKVSTNSFSGVSANESSSEPAGEPSEQSSVPAQRFDRWAGAKGADKIEAGPGAEDQDRSQSENQGAESYGGTDNDSMPASSADAADASDHDSAVASRTVFGVTQGGVRGNVPGDANDGEAVDEEQSAAAPSATSPDVAIAEKPTVSDSDDARATESPVADGAHPLDDVKPVVAPYDTGDDALFDTTMGRAALEIRNGAKSGQTLEIDKPVTTLGRPGIQIAAIMRKPDGYFLMHVESDESTDRPTLNDDAIGDDPVPLRSGDELRVAGVDVQFTLN